MLYLCEDGGVGGVGGVEEGARINTETIGPEMEGSGYWAAGRGGVGGGVGDYFAGGVIAAKGTGCAGETGGWGLRVVAARAGHVSDSVRLGVGYIEDLHRTYLFARSMIFFFRSSGFSTARPDFSPPAYRF